MITLKKILKSISIVMRTMTLKKKEKLRNYLSNSNLNLNKPFKIQLEVQRIGLFLQHIT